MDGGTLIGRLDRIEAALDRIEAETARVASERLDYQPAPEFADIAPQQDGGLRDRHAALQASVRTALARLDALIEDAQG
ncbi:hypothetical protein [Novosphingobium sp. 9U]|uniref:hypothetical protein n=1 Tax=Novosphingobium sp. 9U TaxID=2653158 RepID=UPI0012EFDB07|nr:hypothetical protein [Novosphingobium sp. 9U]VWX54670.1 conserved hypothetical protein [Novosphingobium sp. 9U]